MSSKLSLSLITAIALTAAAGGVAYAQSMGTTNSPTGIGQPGISMGPTNSQTGSLGSRNLNSIPNPNPVMPSQPATQFGVPGTVR